LWRGPGRRDAGTRETGKTGKTVDIT